MPQVRLVYETTIYLSPKEAEELPHISDPRQYLQTVLNNRETQNSEIYIKVPVKKEE